MTGTAVTDRDGAVRLTVRAGVLWPGSPVSVDIRPPSGTRTAETRVEAIGGEYPTPPRPPRKELTEFPLDVGEGRAEELLLVQVGVQADADRLRPLRLGDSRETPWPCSPEWSHRSEVRGVRASVNMLTRSTERSFATVARSDERQWLISAECPSPRGGGDLKEQAFATSTSAGSPLRRSGLALLRAGWRQVAAQDTWIAGHDPDQGDGGAWGRRRPCSQFCRVSTLMPAARANSSWVMPTKRRSAATSSPPRTSPRQSPPTPQGTGDRAREAPCWSVQGCRRS